VRWRTRPKKKEKPERERLEGMTNAVCAFDLPMVAEAEEVAMAQRATAMA
jgi:hypothetical protein